jgi:GAF domain-containing protein
MGGQSSAAWKGKQNMMEPMMRQLADARHQDMLDEAARERRARRAAAAQSQTKGFRINLGGLRISVELDAPANPVARPGLS